MMVSGSRPIVVIGLLALGCGVDSGETVDSTIAAPGGDSARAAFARETASLLLDTQVHELRGQLTVKARNNNPNDPEAPLVDQPVPHPADPGPHTYLGVMHAEIGALRALLGDTVPVSIEGERVFAGRPEVLLNGHRHGNDLYVPIRLFARVYGAYVRTHCPLANCADVWPRDILIHMRRTGYLHSAGVLDGYLEGLLDSVNVRKLPSGD
ncbi:MAG TPA: hypothetical protein VF128_06655 [Gemmatimonadaceae bacterium]